MNGGQNKSLTYFNEKMKLVSSMKLRLREIREKHDLTVREMAKKMKISKSYYSAFETGEKVIPLNHLINFCNLFHLSIDYVLGIKDFNIVPKRRLTFKEDIYFKRIREIRKSNKLTQKQLAEAIKIEQPTLSSYETGHSIMPTATLYPLCKKLNISADYVLGFTNTMNIIVDTLH